MSMIESAERLAHHYVDGGNVAAVVAAGSVGRGRSDEYSDLELDVYWTTPPSDAQRLGPIRAAGGHLERLWPYEAAESEWSEDLVLDGAAVTVSGFTVTRLESWIEQVTVHGDPDPIKQMRLSAVNEGTVVYGLDRVTGWRRRSAYYPTQLATAVAAASLAPGRLSMWKHWRALSARGDLLALRTACTEGSEAILGSLCALNRVLIEHPRFKWVTPMLQRFELAPVDVESRFLEALDADAARCAEQLADLLFETVQLVQHELPGVDIGDVLGLWR